MDHTITCSDITETSPLPKGASVLDAVSDIKCVALTLSVENSIALSGSSISQKPNSGANIFKTTISLYFLEPLDSDLKDVLGTVISRLSYPKFIYKTSSELLVKAIENNLSVPFGTYNLVVKFIKFPSIKSLIGYFDWVNPIVVYHNGKQYMGGYTTYCLKERRIPRFVRLDDEQCVYNIPLSSQAKGCTLCKVTLGLGMYDSPGDLMKLDILAIARGTKSEISCICSPNSWDQEGFNVNAELVSCVTGYASRSERSISKDLYKNTSKPLAFRKVLGARLPCLKLIDPPDLCSMMCEDCLVSFRPSWEPKYYSCHKRHILNLYLVLGSMGLCGDLVQHIYSLMCLLDIKDRIQNYLRNPKKLTG